MNERFRDISCEAMASCRVLIWLTTFASGLVVAVLLLSTALPAFREAVEEPVDALLPGVVDYGRESGPPLPQSTNPDHGPALTQH